MQTALPSQLGAAARKGSLAVIKRCTWRAWLPVRQKFAVAGKLPFDHAPPDDRQLPDMHMALYNTVIVFDQATKLAYVITWVHLDRHASLEEAYHHGQRQLQITSRKIENEHSPNLTNGKVGVIESLLLDVGYGERSVSSHLASFTFLPSHGSM